MSLRLVDSFSPDDYPAYHARYFDNPFDSTEVYSLKDRFSAAINALEIPRYKLMVKHSYIEARFPDFTDLFRFSVAINPQQPVDVDYFFADLSSTNRFLDKMRKSLRKLIKQNALENDVVLSLDRGNKAITVRTTDAQSFLRFDAACRKTKGQHLSALQAG